MLERTDLSRFGPRSEGKVRDAYDLGDGLLALVTTDRLSAFDRVLAHIPHKGQVLNQLAAWWFDETADVVANHLVAVPDPNVTVGRRCATLPVEVVVRGYITGVTSTSLWTRYDAGERTMYGLRLPDGLRRNDRLPEPVITPTTKAEAGGHDEPLSPAEVVERGLVEASLWQRTCEAALAIFERGTERAAAGGLTLVDTKYEFGLDDDGLLTLIDEVHTPDSSRYWLAGGTEPMDKELARSWWASQGYRGDGAAPALPADVVAELSRRYVTVYERLTGSSFVAAAEPEGPRIEANLAAWLAGRGED
ncbi:MAG: phosphoribosylaminoimidazolesuccinocarboxamide synthase [Acidimicrobiia bacterium]|nr:phosphoribosylaminoimidazolesuccinocarboxamide synthase [Acidimicrobiia bacterium]